MQVSVDFALDLQAGRLVTKDRSALWHSHIWGSPILGRFNPQGLQHCLAFGALLEAEILFSWVGVNNTDHNLVWLYIRRRGRVVRCVRVLSLRSLLPRGRGAVLGGVYIGPFRRGGWGSCATRVCRLITWRKLRRSSVYKQSQATFLATVCGKHGTPFACRRLPTCSRLRLTQKCSKAHARGTDIEGP